jgi:hypothetical protein
VCGLCYIDERIKRQTPRHVGEAETGKPKRNKTMISDVLFEARTAIEQYLKDLPDVYSGTILRRLTSLLQEMEAIQRELDTPPSMPAQSETIRE